MSIIIKNCISLLPRDCLTSCIELLKAHDKNSAAITGMTGIYKKMVYPKELTLDRAYQLLSKEAKKIGANEPDYIFTCTQTPDKAIPPPSFILINKNNLWRNDPKGNTDINTGCTGFVDLIRLTKSIINDEGIKTIYCFTGDILSRIVSKSDYATNCLLGDLINLTIVEKIPDHMGNEIEFGNFKSFIAKEFDGAIERDLSTSLKMDGLKVMSFVMQFVIKNLISYIKEIGKLNDLNDYTLILHQANKMVVNTINRSVKNIFPKIHCLDFCMENHGNSASSTIPFTITNAVSSGLCTEKVIICGYGSGMSMSIGVVYIDLKSFTNNMVINQNKINK